MSIGQLGQRAGMSLGPIANMVSQIASLEPKMQQLQELASELGDLQQVPQQLQVLTHQIEQVKDIAKKSLAVFAGFDYELTKQRFVNLRIQHHILFGSYDTNSVMTVEQRAQEMLDLEVTFRAEYDAIMALGLLVSKAR